MAKVYLVIKDVDMEEDGRVRFIYTALLIGPPHLKYSSDYWVNPTLSMQENEDAMKLKIVNDAVSRGVKMSTGDVISPGSSFVKDTTSRTNKVNGITSDTSAVAVEPVAPKDLEQPTMMARATDAFKNSFNWMFS